MKITVKNRQNIFDIALRYQGSAEAAFEIARNNNISISDVLEPGTELEISPIVYNKSVIDNFKINDIEPATGYSEKIRRVITGIDGIYLLTNNTEMSVLSNINF